MRRLFLVLLSLTFSVGMFSQPADLPAGDNPAAVVTYEQPADAPVYEVVTPTPVVITGQIPEGIFKTFFALVAFIPLAVQFLRKLILPDSKGIVVQIFSWAVGIAVTLAGWLLHLGFLDGLSFWLALLYGIGACLAANGIFDTGLVTAIFSLFGKKAPAKI